MLAGCGGSGSSGHDIPVVTPSLVPIDVSGVPVDMGNFDPAPTVDAGGQFWMSYSHVAIDTSGINLIETRLASSPDAGDGWADAGVSVNPAAAFTIGSDTVAWAQEVSRLVYDPFAAGAGADPWIVVWHRYLSILAGGETLRLFDNGWIGMKSGSAPTTLGGERKLFTGSAYNAANDVTIGPPEVKLDTLDAALNDCVTFSEPGLLPKSGGIYVSLFCATAAPPGKIILLRCDHQMNNCSYRGVLIDGSEASVLDAGYDNFSASELVSVSGRDYLVVTPSEKTVYRGCAIYRIDNLDQARIERDGAIAKATAIFEAHGEFNGACGYVEGLAGSGVMIGEAFTTSIPVFRLFATNYNF
ncbi:MAG: hypothetical protein PVJ78_01105 [Gammaproteobacteria bacterium]|jgi:hypothetical protein